MRRLTFGVLCWIAGCSDSKTERPAEFAHPESLQAALENPIVDCQLAAVQCNDGVSDFAARIACNDVLASCLREAAQRAQYVAQRVEACREDGRVCLQDGIDEDVCRDNYEACTEAALNSGTDAGTAVDAAVGAAPEPEFDAGIEPLPGLPSVDAGPLEDLPAPVKCTIELRLCIAIDLTAAAQCADTARVCLQLP
jgi:hypothetical protein